MSECKNKYYNRGFLNEGEGTALFELEFASHYYDYNGKYDSEFSGHFTIKDCTRTCHLEFDFSTEEGRVKRLNKVDILIAELETLRKAIEAHEITPTKEETDE